MKNNPTMLVYVDGKKEQRQIVHMEPDDVSMLGRDERFIINRPVPETKQGESVVWLLNGQCHIFKGYL